MENDFIKALHNEEHSSTPVWYMRQAGRYLQQYRDLRKEMGILELCHRPDRASEISYIAARETGADAAIIFSDISIPMENMGYSIDFVEGTGPVFSEKREVNNIQSHPAADAIKEFRKNHDDLPVIGFTGGPFTIFCYMDGKKKEDAKIRMITDRENSMNILKNIGKIIQSEAIAQVEAGADAIQIFDSWIGMLGLDLARSVIEQIVAPIVHTIRSRNVPVIYFSKGTSAFFKTIMKTGADFINPDWSVPVSNFDSENTGIQGNLDPDIVLHNPSLAVQLAGSMAYSMKDHRKYIFNLGHGVLPGTDAQTLRDISKTVKKVIL